MPADVRRAILRASEKERAGTQARQALSIIKLNIDMAHTNVSPICQDTGMPTFFVHTPVGVNQIVIRKAIRSMVEEATRAGKLRPKFGR